jgi:hypothetical protein
MEKSCIRFKKQTKSFDDCATSPKIAVEDWITMKHNLKPWKYNYENYQRILFGLLGIIALALIVALFMPKEYAVEREWSSTNQNTVFNIMTRIR